MPEPTFPSPSLPTIFADGVSNFFHSPEVGKFYFSRIDPELEGGPEIQQQIVAQVVMPMTSFVNTAAFFMKAVDRLIAQGAVSREQWAGAQESYTNLEFKK
jgi:hypothetical protein